MLFLFTEHRFVNRGVYEGSYLPIYGVGGLLLCLLLTLVFAADAAWCAMHHNIGNGIVF